MKLLQVSIFLLLAFACNKPIDSNSALDFSLVYEDDVDRIDFDANTMTRKYIGSVRTIKVNIGEENRRRILDFILDNEVLSIKDSQLRNDCEFFLLPMSAFKVELTIDKGQPKQFDWTSNDCGDEIEILNQLASLIREQTESQIPAGKLEPTNIIRE